MPRPEPTRTRTRSPGSISTSRELRSHGEVVPGTAISNTEKVDADLQDIRNPAHVMIKGGITRNMGDYNSVSVAVSVTMPCAPTDEAIQSTYEKIAATVDDLLNNELAVATGEEVGATDRPTAI